MFSLSSVLISEVKEAHESVVNLMNLCFSTLVDPQTFRLDVFIQKLTTKYQTANRPHNNAGVILKNTISVNCDGMIIIIILTRQEFTAMLAAL